MAISVKDIQEKEFAIVEQSGYDVEQVDDFLDELAEQLSAMLQENHSLSEKVKELQTSLATAEATNAEMEKKLPDYNEKGYFKNLESAIRESLISAQRIADEAVSTAQQKAKQMVEDAGAQAEKTVAEANEHAKIITDNAEQNVSRLNAEAESLSGKINSYKESIKKLISEQLAFLNGDDAQK